MMHEHPLIGLLQRIMQRPNPFVRQPEGGDFTDRLPRMQEPGYRDEIQTPDIGSRMPVYDPRFNADQNQAVTPDAMKSYLLHRLLMSLI